MLTPARLNVGTEYRENEGDAVSAIDEYRKQRVEFLPQTPLRDQLADAAVAKLETQTTLLRDELDDEMKMREQAEAKLAERDRMLRWLWGHTPKVNYLYEQWLADLRARASAAPEPGFECNDICESCEWHAPGTDQGPCTTDDPREQPDDCPRADETL